MNKLKTTELKFDILWMSLIAGVPYGAEQFKAQQ